MDTFSSHVNITRNLFYVHVSLSILACYLYDVYMATLVFRLPQTAEIGSTGRK